MLDNSPTPNTPRARKSPKTSARRHGQRFKSPEERQQAKDVFIKTFAQTANVLASCRASGVDRSTVDEWREHDVTFTVRYHTAERDAIDVLRAEAFRRAVQGVDEPLTSMGKIVMVKGDDGKERPLTVKKYSDSVLLALLKARAPEMKESTTKIDITSNGQTVGQLDLTTLMTMRETMGVELSTWRQERFGEEPS